MARVTVEDCVTRIPNRFELVSIAAQRARHISAGAPLTIERDNDKNPVVSLREIADGTVVLPDLEESLIKSLQKYVQMEESIEDLETLISEPIQIEATAEANGDEGALEVDDTSDTATMGAEVVFKDAEIGPED